MAERLIGATGLTNVNSEEAIGGVAKQLAWNFKTSAANKQVTNIYVKMTSAGTFVTGTKAILWKRAAVVADSTIEVSIEIGGLSAASGTGLAVPGWTPWPIIQNDFYMVSIFHPSTQTGNNWFKAGFGAPTSPPNPTLSGNCIYYDSSATATTPPQFEGFTDGAFGIDVEIDEIGGHAKGAEFLSFF